MAGKEIHITLPEDTLETYKNLALRKQQIRESATQNAAEIEHQLAERRTKYVTRNEIRKLKEGTVTYRSCGKAFIIQPKATIITNLTKELESADKTIYMLKKVLVNFDHQEDVIQREIQDLVRPFVPKQ